MATAYKCDRCNKYFNEFNKVIKYGEYSIHREIELCKECSQAFEKFMKEGVQNEQ